MVALAAFLAQAGLFGLLGGAALGFLLLGLDPLQVFAAALVAGQMAAGGGFFSQPTGARCLLLGCGALLAGLLGQLLPTPTVDAVRLLDPLRKPGELFRQPLGQRPVGVVALGRADVLAGLSPQGGDLFVQLLGLLEQLVDLLVPLGDPGVDQRGPGGEGLALAQHGGALEAGPVA